MHDFIEIVVVGDAMLPRVIPQDVVEIRLVVRQPVEAQCRVNNLPNQTPSDAGCINGGDTTNVGGSVVEKLITEALHIGFDLTQTRQFL